MTQLSPYYAPGIGRPQLSVIRNIVAQFYGFNPEEIAVKCRKRDLVTTRQVVSWTGYYLGYSTGEIADIIRKDHATVLHGKDTIDDYLTYNMELLEELSDICFKLNLNIDYNTTKKTAKISLKNQKA